jgi:hypothetical protein
MVRLLAGSKSMMPRRSYRSRGRSLISGQGKNLVMYLRHRKRRIIQRPRERQAIHRKKSLRVGKRSLVEASTTSSSTTPS